MSKCQVGSGHLAPGPGELELPGTLKGGGAVGRGGVGTGKASRAGGAGAPSRGWGSGSLLGRGRQVLGCEAGGLCLTVHSLRAETAAVKGSLALESTEWVLVKCSRTKEWYYYSQY